MLNPSYKNISVAEAKKLMASTPAPIIIDVRSAAELAEGSIPGHRLINLMGGTFKEEIKGLDPQKTYLVYCRSGNRSSVACQQMASMGFQHLYNLSGGIHAWNQQL